MFTPLLSGTRIPPAVELPVVAPTPPATSVTWPKGALLIDTAGVFTEATSPVTARAGATHVAMGLIGPDVSGFNKLGDQNVPPHMAQGFPTRNQQRFAADYTDALPQALGGSYDVVKNAATGEWEVDFGSAGTAVYLEAWGTAMEIGDAQRHRVVVYFLDDAAAPIG